MSQAETNVLPFAAKRKRPDKRTGTPVRPNFQPIKLPPFTCTNQQWAGSNLPYIRLAIASSEKSVAELEDAARLLRSAEEKQITGLLNEYHRVRGHLRG